MSETHSVFDTAAGASGGENSAPEAVAIVSGGSGGSSSTSGTVTQGTSPWVENLAQVGGSAIALGQAAKAASLPVALASDTGNLPTTDANGGAAVSGSAMPSGGSGFLGWLSAIYTRLAGTLTVGGTVAVSGGTVSLSGTSAISGTVSLAGTSTVSGSVALTGTSPIQGVSGGVPVPTTDSNGGTSATAPTMPAGGAGLLGWLSGLYSSFTNTVTTAVVTTAPTNWQWVYDKTVAANVTAVNSTLGGNNVTAYRLTSGAASTMTPGAPSRTRCYDLTNTTSGLLFFQIYNKASAPVPGTDTPIVTFALQANQTRTIMFQLNQGLAAALGTQFAVTSDFAGATAVTTSGAVVGMVFY